MRKSRTILIGMLTFLTLPKAVLGQGLPHFVEKLTVGDGLTSNIITGLAEDANGFLYIATPDGLNRFDGTETVHYLQGPKSLPHNYINCLTKLRSPWLAIGTQAGLSFFNTATGEFRNFYSHHQPSLDRYNNNIISVDMDANGNYWVVAAGCIYVFDPKFQLKKIIPSPYTEATAAKERVVFVFKLIPLANGDVLLCLLDGWARYSVAADSIIHYRQPPSWLPTGDIAAFPAGRLFRVRDNLLLSIPPAKDSLILLDDQGRQQSSIYFPYNHYPYVSWAQQVVTIDSTQMLLLLNNFGLIVINLRWEAGAARLNSLSPLLFNGDEYRTALSDHQGNLWLATTKEGLQKVSSTRQHFICAALIDRQTNLPIRHEIMSCNKWDSTLWLSTYGDGLYEIDLRTGRQIRHRLTGTGDDTWANFVWSATRQDKDTLFLGTQKGLFWYRRGNGQSGRLPAYPGKPRVLDSVAITTQFHDSRGLLWMGLGKANGLCVYDRILHRFTWYPGNTADGYPLRYPTDMTEDSRGNLWFTNDASNLLIRWDRKSNHFSTVRLPTNGQNCVGPLKGLCAQGDSVLWTADITGGLVKFNVRENTAVFYSQENGLNNCHISNIHRDEQNRLWLVTEGGLVCFDPVNQSFTNYTTKDGLPVSYPTSDLFYDQQAKRLYTGGHGFWFYFNPKDIQPGHWTKNTLITALQVNGIPRNVSTDSSLVFHYEQNDITIQYAAVDLVEGPSTHYFYRLIGADTNWVSAGKQRQINFSHLSPGHYTFQVRATGPASTGNASIAALSFRIQPPFTQTAIFFTLIGIILAVGIFILYRYRRNQASRTRQIRSEISRNLHDEVGANLTNISLSSLLAQRQLHNDGAVCKILERIYQDSQQVSESMRDIVWSINPDIDTLGEALPRMLHYASTLLEANNIELQAEILPEVERLRLTMKQRRDVYLIFKEAINNMVRHSRASRAIVQFCLSGKTLLMKIDDDGAGFDPGKCNGSNGLKNMRERARQHRWKLDIRSRPQQGTTIILKTA